MIIGNLTRDPEMRTTPTGVAVCSFAVATNLVWSDASGQKKEKVEYHNIVAWQKLAEICGQYLTKGRQIYLEGRLQTSDWVGQDGIKRYKTEIIANNMIMLGARTAVSTGMPAGVSAGVSAGVNVAKPVTQEGQIADQKPVSAAVPGSVPSVSSEEPAESVGPAMPANESAASSAGVSDIPTESLEGDDEGEEDIKVEDIPF